MHAAAINLRGGVSPRNTHFRGQSIIEYVLIIAIIGLVIVFAGPGVAGAIRNQFNLVGNTVNNESTGGGEGDGASGGSGGNVPDQEQIKYLESMKSVTEKDAKDWTLDDQQKAAEDIAKRGTASVAFSKAKAAMDDGITWSIKLTNGQTLEYKIIGINHDDLADGSGKAGLTFLTTSMGIEGRMNPPDWGAPEPKPEPPTEKPVLPNRPKPKLARLIAKSSASIQGYNGGGWEASELRAKMNSGEVWNLMPSDFQSKVKSVRKLTNNVGGGDENKNAAVTATSDRLFLLSYSETVNYIPYGFAMDPDYSMYSWLPKEGSQYEAFQGQVFPHGTSKLFRLEESLWSSVRWGRSCGESQDVFMGIPGLGDIMFYNYRENGSKTFIVCPAFCF